jgi:O-antigen/teichoic acid export membrane protein
MVTRLIVDRYGPDAYAQYGLLVGIGALLPFTDLGMSAAVMNAVAESPEPSRDEHVRRTLLTAIRVLLGSALLLTAVTLGITLLGGWHALFGAGLGSGGSAAAAACLFLIALAIPVGIGQRMLIGLGRNHVAVLLLGLQTPIVLGVLLLVTWLGIRVPDAVAAIPYAVAFVLSVWCTWLAARRLRPVFRDAVRAVLRLRAERGAKVLDVAWPMLVQLVAVPLAMQSDRLVLSHVRGAGELARYTLAAQMFTPIWAVVNAAGFALWPVFARARARGASQSPFPLALGFAGAGLVASTVIAVASPWLAALATGGKVTVPAHLAVGFSALMLVQAAKFPLGMFLTDARGLRFQAAMIAAMLPVNLGLSVLLAGTFGAVGPVIASVVGVTVFELVANALYVRRRLARERAVPGDDEQARLPRAAEAVSSR